MVEIMNIREVKDYFKNAGKHYSAKSCGAFVHNGKLDINLSSEFTQLIREAARCNRYASDIIYDIGNVNDKLSNFNLDDYSEFDLPIFAMGFRRDGVDGNSFILSRLNNSHNGSMYGLYKEYFAIYFMEVVRDKDYPDHFRVETVGYTL